ncbi:hypothetical protein QAD02_024173 [Eretmocerus hayati]|uniref:Uncharacterized protein n=1 Tax=Eretmocerus hayati TaxID=131215 RepID=A0ACC2PZI0_9HYME|nr:hypothetical protein QAD02_024173 [Eretmocerus hayati]
MEEYTKVTIQKKDANFIIFNIESSAIKDSTSIEYRSPVFSFKDNPKDECFLSFISVLKEKAPTQKVPGMTLHFTDNQAGQEDSGTYQDACTYQVVCSVLNRPEFGIHAFQSHRYGIGELKHWKFFSLNELSKALNKNSVVQLCFDVSRFLSGNVASIMSTFVPKNDDKMLTKLYSFAQNGEFTDVILKIGNEEIKAHKNVLAARSNVFDAMFKSKMQEEQTGVVKVEDFKPDVIKEMLLYIYTDSVKDIQKVSYELFEAAHFYNLLDLETICKNHMKDSVTCENVTVLSDLADKYSLKDIQTVVRKFMKTNEAQLIKNPDYVAFLLSRLSVKNVAQYLVLADKYKLKDFKAPLKEYVKDNIKEVMKDSKYRYLYSTNINIILEIDEYMADQYGK